MPAAFNTAALEPLFAPAEEPNAHRVRSEKEGAPATIVRGRRRSPIAIAQNLRRDVRIWRENGYAGASETTRHLLAHWFERSHLQQTPAGETFEFRYYFCQREAVETFIYLKEVRQLERLSQLIAEYGGDGAEIAALGITEDEDLWTRYAFKLATGTGKTKVMSLAVVWSYFHALRESESPLARHFIVIAPNLTVYERLKDDFRPGDGRADIFDADPLIPAEWRGDWNLSVVLQGEEASAATGGVLYLTNIHRLYDTTKRKRTDRRDEYDWLGPKVAATTLDTATSLRERVATHPRVLILNDEAHHVWDAGSAWNEAIAFLHGAIKQRGGDGISAQLDFSATPKDNKGQVFKHVVCDTPLGEAVDGGIVKVPIVGRSKIAIQPGDDAAVKYEEHLLLGYDRWRKSFEEWRESGKKPLLFVMCENTDAADQITHRLNTDALFKELNGATINLHTNLKGKIKKIGRGASASYEFVETEKDISDEDLQQLRKLSRELDTNASPYRCIVSVLMLREGWDVRNVTTIVPLRAYSSKANILPEQTLGRGLRRMTPPGQATEVVTVVEHPAFANLYAAELAQEGLPIEIVDLDAVPRTTVTIFPDPSKDIVALDIQVPRLTAGHSVLPTLEGLSIEDVAHAFERYERLPLGGRGRTAIDYEGRHLFSGEVVEKTRIDLPLLSSGVGAVSYFVRQLETICRIRGTHGVLAPLVQQFLEEILFERKTTLFDHQLVPRLVDADVQEHVRAVFVPLIRAKTIKQHKRARAPEAEPMRLSTWKPFQVTHSERHPVVAATRTLFNLVPCNRALEEALATLAERASDVAAFAKNAGPQSLRIDYLQTSKQLAFYTPDFFVRMNDGAAFLVETKGREDRDVPRKARAAIAWCEAASKSGVKWEYVYLPQGVFETFSGDSFHALVRACRPSLGDLLEEKDEQRTLFSVVDERSAEISDLVETEKLDALPPRYRRAVEQSATLFRFMEKKGEMNFGAVFMPLLGSLDEAARALLVRRLESEMPATMPEQRLWFEPELHKVEFRQRKHYETVAQNLKRTLVYSNGVSPLGLLRSCMDFALNDRTNLTGVFASVRSQFRFSGGRDLLASLQGLYDFRNTYVAHQEHELTDAVLAKRELRNWIGTLERLTET